MRQAPGEKPRAFPAPEPDPRLAAGADDSVRMAELEICRDHNLLYNLHRVDSLGRRSKLTDCERHRFAAALDDGRVAAVRVEAGDAEVVVLEHGKPVQTLYRTGPGETISGLAAKGRRGVITSLRDGRWALVEVGDSKPVVLINDEAVKHSPRFGDASDEIFFVADYGKSYDVWSWKRGSPTLSRWTRTAFGVREISAPVRGEMLLTTIEPDGGALWMHRLPLEPLERRELRIEARGAAAPGDAVVAEDRRYSPWPSLRPTAWAPLVQIADGSVALGAIVYGQDALQLHQYLLAPMVELTQGELLGRAEYLYDGRHGMVANRTLTVRATHPGSSTTQITAYTLQPNEP